MCKSTIISKRVKLMNVTSDSCRGHTHTHLDTFMWTHTPTQEVSHTFILTASAIRQAHAHIWRAGQPNIPGLQPISALTDKDVLPSDARSGFH